MYKNIKHYKLLSILMIIVILFSYLPSIILAKEVGDSSKLTIIGSCRQNVEFKFDSRLECY